MDKFTKRQTCRHLVEAVKNGNESRVVELLDGIGWHALHSVSFLFLINLLNVREGNDTGTLLHVACCYRQPKLVKLCLEKNANPNARSRGKLTSPLHLSANLGDEESCALLISYGCAVDSVDIGMRTPLLWASLRNKLGAAELLIKHHADVNHGDDNGRMPMHYAALNGNLSMTQRFANAGASINCLDLEGKTPLHHACNRGNVCAVELLLRLGAAITVIDKKQHTALYHALSPEIKGEVHLRQHLEIARLLIFEAGLRSFAPEAGNLQQEKTVLEAEPRYAFACALKTVDKHLKRDALEYAGVNVSQVLDRESRLHALQNAVAERSLEKVCILASVGEAMKSASAEVVAKSLCLAVDKKSAELALVVLQSNSTYKIDSKVLRHILGMGVSLRSLPLVLAAFQTGARAESNVSVAEEVLHQAMVGGFANLSFVVDLCKAGVLDVAGPQATLDVLSFALEQSSTELALLACKACRAHAKTDVPHWMMQAALDLALNTACLTLALEAVQGGALESGSSDVVGNAVHLGLEAGPTPLLKAVLSLANVRHSTFQKVLHFALEKESTELALLMCRACLRFNVVVSDSLILGIMKLALKTSSEELAIFACQEGALLSASSERVSEILRLGLKTESIMLLKTVGSLAVVGTPTFVDVLQFALEHTSAELALLASKACARFIEAVPHSMMEAALQLGLRESSAELAVVACLGGGLTEKILEPASASIAGDTLVRLLQLAVQEGSAQLAIIAFKAGAMKSADHPLLARALELAIQTSAIELLSILANAGTLQHSTDKVKEKVLQHAAIAGDLQLADRCIFSGVFHGVDHWDKPTAIDIAVQRGHSRLADKLRKALDCHKLLGLEQRNANTVLIRVVGSPGAGKSTLVQSLRTSRLWGFFRWESQADDGDKNFHTRTKGIQVDSYEDSSGTRYRIWISEVSMTLRVPISSSSVKDKFRSSTSSPFRH